LFAQHGAKVAVVDLSGDNAAKVANEIRAAGGDAIAIQADVSKDADVRRYYEETEKKYGLVNVIFNNAGISHADDDDAINTTEDIWDLTMKINVKGVFLGCKHGIPALKRAGGGSIINTASFVAVLGAATPQLAYTSSKGAVLAMSRELAVIHARQKIRVNALCPGPLNTELLQKYLNTPEKRNRRVVHIPMGRFGEAEEIANATLFLASDESSFVTGSTFLVDGGITAAYVTPE
jgi:NAD(P)-dependent dehydrogenase (short-subunit alcohol dehydrogenase family)